MFWIVINGREEIAHIIITIHFALRLRSLRACSLEVVLGKSLKMYGYYDMGCFFPVYLQLIFYNSKEDFSGRTD